MTTVRCPNCNNQTLDASFWKEMGEEALKAVFLAPWWFVRAHWYSFKMVKDLAVDIIKKENAEMVSLRRCSNCFSWGVKCAHCQHVFNFGERPKPTTVFKCAKCHKKLMFAWPVSNLSGND